MRSLRRQDSRIGRFIRENCTHLMHSRIAGNVYLCGFDQVSTPNPREIVTCASCALLYSSRRFFVREPWAVALVRTCLVFRLMRLRRELSEIEQIRDQLQSHSVRMKKSELTLKQVSAVPCPTCGVAIGMPCVLHSGRKRLEPHVDRKLAAIEALEAIYSGQQYYFFASSPLK
jgi:hypothetical protein